MQEIDIANMPEEEFQKMMLQQIKQSEAAQRNVDNVFFDNVIKDDFENYSDHKDAYISRVLTYLENNFESFNDYHFVIHSSDNSEFPNTKDLSYLGKKIVLIATSCEKKYSQFEKVKDDYHHIFANYHWDTDHVTSIPLGYYAKPDLDTVPMEERLFNMNFVGCLNRNRLELASKVSKIPLTGIILSLAYNPNFIIKLINHITEWINPRDYIVFTTDFAKGFDELAYLNLLNSSKISLCPRGWRNIETFRLYESMRAGCVVITEKLPHRSYYKNIPAIQVNNWHDGLNIAKDLLKDNSALLTRLGEASRKFYEEKLSPEATAKIIISKLAEKAI